MNTYIFPRLAIKDTFDEAAKLMKKRGYKIVREEDNMRIFEQETEDGKRLFAAVGIINDAVTVTSDEILDEYFDRHLRRESRNNKAALVKEVSAGFIKRLLILIFGAAVFLAGVGFAIYFIIKFLISL